MQSSSSEMEVYVNELQKKFDRLKVLYEQYFMGIEKMEPLTARKEMSRAIITLQQVHLRSTGLRFKVATLIQKWNIYQSYWGRTMRDIEAGRYTRHVATARRHAAQAGLSFPAEEMGLTPRQPSGETDPGAPPSVEDASAEPERAAEAAAAPLPERPVEQARHPAPAPRPPPPVRPPPPPVAETSGVPEIPGLSTAELRELHHRVVSAQRAAGDTAEVRFEALAMQLSRQVPKLMAEHGCKGVTFEVITRDGKVKLKPSPLK